MPEPAVTGEARLAPVVSYLISLQDRICTALSEEDPGAALQEERWQYRTGGGGCSRTLMGGEVVEKAGVNFSQINGPALPSAASQRHPELAGSPFEAVGVSVVVHPRNPYAPTSHANLRCFIVHGREELPTWWFGGGYDLSPCFGFEEDCRHWHQVAQSACRDFGAGLYERCRDQCRDYFYLPHRKEHRGIGGLFFEDFDAGGFEHCLAFLRSVGNSYLEAYRPILVRRSQMPYQERERAFQLHRRGRYVEFNLLHDRGTRFGIESGGRTESILMSLPPMVSWRGDSPSWAREEKLLVEEFLSRQAWL